MSALQNLASGCLRLLPGLDWTDGDMVAGHFDEAVAERVVKSHPSMASIHEGKALVRPMHRQRQIPIMVDAGGAHSLVMLVPQTRRRADPVSFYGQNLAPTQHKGSQF